MEGYCERPGEYSGISRSIRVSESYIRGTDERTRGDALMRLQASPYNTVAEFLEKSSDVKEYTRRTERPAPIKMTPRFVVRAVVRRTVRERRQ